MSYDHPYPTPNANQLADFTYVLTAEDSSALVAAADQPDNLRGPEESVTDYALRLEGRQDVLPEGVATAISDFSANGNALGGLLVRGFEIDVDGVDPARAKAVGELILLSAATLVGRPYGYASQRDGEIIQNLTPKKEHADKQLGTGNATTLEWHTEDAHTKLNCDVIALLCMRGAPDAATLVSQIEPDALDPAVRAALEQPDYVIEADGSYVNSSDLRTAVIDYKPDGRLEVRYDPLYTQCPSLEAEAALGALTDHINARAQSVVLDKGDLFLIDNGTSVHARSPFTAKYDGKDRWLQRVGVFSKPVPSDKVVANNELVIDL